MLRKWQKLRLACEDSASGFKGSGVWGLGFGFRGPWAHGSKPLRCEPEVPRCLGSETPEVMKSGFPGACHRKNFEHTGFFFMT